MSYFTTRRNIEMPNSEQALPGRAEAMPVDNEHYVLHRPIKPPFPENCEDVVVGMGCFWGAEKAFWGQEGVYTTAVGYAQGFTPNPEYREVCSGMTGHNEVVRVIYDPAKLNFSKLLQIFWESHDPTQGMRQGNDLGTQYRSGIYVTSEQQLKEARDSFETYQKQLRSAGLGEITTEIEMLKDFYYAESYHQQYLAKNPGGYCGMGGTGVSCRL